MRRLAIAIGVLVVLGAGVALWALARSGRNGGPGDAQTARVQRRPAADTSDAERAERREQARTRDQAGPTDKERAAGPPAPGDGPDRGAGPGGWGPPPEMSEADRARMREQMMERMLDEAGLTAKEKSAARAAIKAKDQTRQALADKLTSLRRTANKSKPTDQELKDALGAYRSAMARYRNKVAAEDGVLVKQLSLRGQVRCMSLGVLDNGLGGFGPGGPGGPRPPR